MKNKKEEYIEISKKCAICNKIIYSRKLSTRGRLPIISEWIRNYREMHLNPYKIRYITADTEESKNKCFCVSCGLKFIADNKAHAKIYTINCSSSDFKSSLVKRKEGK